MLLTIILPIALIFPPVTEDKGYPYDAREILETNAPSERGDSQPSLSLQVPSCSLFKRWSGLRSKELDESWLLLGEMFFGNLRDSSICMPASGGGPDELEVALYKVLGWCLDEASLFFRPSRDLLIQTIFDELEKLANSADGIPRARIHLVLGCAKEGTVKGARHFAEAYGVDANFNHAVRIAFGRRAFVSRDIVKALELYRSSRFGSSRVSLVTNENFGSSNVSTVKIKKLGPPHVLEIKIKNKNFHLTNKPGAILGWRLLAAGGRGPCTDLIIRKQDTIVGKSVLIERNATLRILWYQMQKRYEHYMSTWCLILLDRPEEVFKEKRRWFGRAMAPALAIGVAPKKITQLLDEEIQAQGIKNNPFHPNYSPRPPRRAP